MRIIISNHRSWKRDMRSRNVLYYIADLVLKSKLDVI